jgi:hypothetical protein
MMVTGSGAIAGGPTSSPAFGWAHQRRDRQHRDRRDVEGRQNTSALSVVSRVDRELDHHRPIDA